MAKIAKEQVWREHDPNKPGAKAKLVGADDHKPDKTYVLVARKGQVVHDEHLQGIDGVGDFFRNTDEQPSAETPALVPGTGPTAPAATTRKAAGKARGSRSSVKVSSKKS